MACIDFYEKPGCINNSRQKELLNVSGHTLCVHDITRCELPRETLQLFFGTLPVADWFNRTAPAIKNGDIDPDTISEEKALEAMSADRLLIRRPLLLIGETRFCGFDIDTLSSYISFKPVPGREKEFYSNLNDDIVTCPNISKKSCT